MTASDIRDAVYTSIEQHEATLPPREYLGASSVGRECAREIWYGFRHGQPKDEFNGRMLRLFEHGRVEEDRIVSDLRKAGFTVHNVKPNGEQYGFEAHDGMFRGHIDGVIIIDGEPHLLECKTASSSSFEKTQKAGVEKDKPEHYAQMQVYMHFVKGKRPLRKALYFVVNKDNDDIYTEIVEYDETKALHLSERAEVIIGTTHEATATPGWKCGWCSFKNMCKAHNKAKDTDKPAVPVARVTCRSCVHSKLERGEWSCKLTQATLGFDDQLKACGDHVFLPDFIGFAEAIGYNERANTISYKRPDGVEFDQGGRHGIPSKSMTIYPENMIDQANVVAMVAEVFGGEVLDEEAPF
jgi:CRISPR/Cas system-associated exonuclease Cas4 (RecB family)